MCKRVLVVDDDEQMRELLSRMLSHNGFEVETAASAEEGLEKVRKIKFDHITTDCELPGMSGIQFAGEVRKLDQRVPIIMITGKPYFMPISAVVAKPMDMHDLMSALTLAAHTMGIWE